MLSKFLYRIKGNETNTKKQIPCHDLDLINVCMLHTVVYYIYRDGIKYVIFYNKMIESKNNMSMKQPVISYFTTSNFREGGGGVWGLQ